MVLQSDAALTTVLGVSFQGPLLSHTREAGMTGTDVVWGEEDGTPAQ